MTSYGAWKVVRLSVVGFIFFSGAPWYMSLMSGSIIFPFFLSFFFFSRGVQNFNGVFFFFFYFISVVSLLKATTIICGVGCSRKHMIPGQVPYACLPTLSSQAIISP